MAIKGNIEKALNQQIANEFGAAYLYLGMAAYFERTNLGGFAKWMKAQSAEEVQHGMKLFNYVIERGGNVSLGPIAQPKGEWDSPLKVFEEVLGHEKKVTEQINALVDLAMAEKDHATRVFLDWFVTEQVEEEAVPAEIIDRLNIVGKSGEGLLLVDLELGKRED